MAPICHNILTIYIDLVSYVRKRQKKISKKLVGNNQEVQHETGDIHLDIFFDWQQYGEIHFLRFIVFTSITQLSLDTRRWRKKKMAGMTKT